MSELLTTHEAAERVGVHVETVRRWIRSGKLPAAHTPGGELRILAEDLLRPRPRAPQMGPPRPTGRYTRALARMRAEAAR